MYKLSLCELKEGMILAEAVFSPKNNCFLLGEGNRLNKRMIKIFKDNGVEDVFISDRYSILVKPAETLSNILDNLFERKIQELAPNIVEANLCDSMVHVAKKCRDITKIIVLDEQIMNYCVQIKITNNNILFNHSINTCVLSLLVAGALNLTTQQMYNVAVGALLHDIGLCEMPFLIGVDNISDQEQPLFQEHPTYGYYFLKENNISREICDIVLHHHERYDGLGYPKKLSKDAIPLGARIVGVCDQYDYLLTVNKLQPYEAIENLYCSGGILFDENIISAFVNNIAVYPLGAIVRLTNEEVGIVVNVRKNLGPRPIVKVFFNRFNKPLTHPKTIDLAIEKTLFIKEVLK